MSKVVAKIEDWAYESPSAYMGMKYSGKFLRAVKMFYTEKPSEVCFQVRSRGIDREHERRVFVRFV